MDSTEEIIIEQAGQVDAVRRLTRSRTVVVASLLLLAGSVGEFLIRSCYQAAEEDLDGAVRAAWQHGYQAGLTAAAPEHADDGQA